MAIRLTTYEHAKDIPELPGTNVFHSTDLFRILEQTPGYRPVLLVAFEGDKPIGKLLCITRRNFRLLGFTEKTYVYGVGEYFNTERKREEIFNELLTYFTTLYKEIFSVGVSKLRRTVIRLPLFQAERVFSGPVAACSQFDTPRTA